VESRGRSPACMVAQGLGKTAEEVMQLTDFNPSGSSEVWDVISNDVELVQGAKLIWANALEGPAARLR